MPRKTGRDFRAKTDRMIRDARKTDDREDLIDTMCRIAEDVAPEVAEDLTKGRADGQRR